MTGECITKASSLLFETGLEPGRAELESVFWLDPCRVPREVRYESLKRGGHDLD